MLEGPVSDRWAVVQAGLFLASLAPERPEAEAYLLPVIEPLARRAESLDPIGLHPHRMRRLVDALQTARMHHPVLQDDAVVNRAEAALRRRAGLLYGYAGAVGPMIECLAPQERDLGGLSDLADIPPRKRLSNVQTMVAGTAVGGELQWVQEHWGRADESDGTFVPVVERLPSWAQSGERATEPVGALRHLHVQLYGPAEGDDHLQVDVAVRETENQNVTEVPLVAARRLLQRRVSGMEERYLQGRLSFNQSHLQHEGRSAGLAIAALFYAAVLRHTHRRRRLRVRPEVVLTGDVTPDGTVQPVAEQGLSVKVRTAFFSPKTCLVVPEAQRDVAEAARDDLLGDFPHGALEIVGVDRLDALFYDRRLTHLKRIGWPRHTAQWLWDRRGTVALGTLIAGLLVVIVALLYGPIDKNPVQVAFEGAEMQLRNQAGQIVDRVSVGEKVVNQAQKSRKPYRAYDLYDITGDGRNEICWSQKTRTDPTGLPVVACRAVGASAPLWRTSLKVDFSLPEKPAVQPNAFAPVHLIVEDLDANGRPEVYLTAKHQPYFPGLVVQYDGHTGEKKRQYVHAGHLNVHPKVLDLDQNGKVQELLIGGTSNAYDQAVAVVLDPRTMDGHGPVTPEYRFDGLPPATERAYLRFPYTPVGKRQQTAHPRVRRIQPRTVPGRIRMEVLEGEYESQSANDQSFVLVHFNYALRPQTIGTSTHYDRLADLLVQRGRLDDIPDADDFAAYRNRIQYWTGGGWTTEPTTNERWRSTVEARSSQSASGSTERRR